MTKKFLKTIETDWNGRSFEAVESFLEGAAEQMGVHVGGVSVQAQQYHAITDITVAVTKGGVVEMRVPDCVTPAQVYGAGLRTLVQPLIEKTANRRSTRKPDETPGFPALGVRAAWLVEDLVEGIRSAEKVTELLPGTKEAVEESVVLQFREDASDLPGAGKLFKRAVYDLAGRHYGRAPDMPEVDLSKALEYLERGEYPWKIAQAIIQAIKDVPRDETQDQDMMDTEITSPDAAGAALITEEAHMELLIVQASSGVSTERFFSEYPERAGHRISSTKVTEAMREELMEERIERERGHFSGILSQPGRVVSDMRVMGKRVLLEDVPDTLIVTLVDNSGSMGGARWTTACELHDNVMRALYELNVPAVSAAYCQQGGEKIKPVCGMGTPPVHLGHAAFPTGGTGDLGAIVWATKQLDEAGKGGRVVFVISDNEGPTQSKDMTKALKRLKAKVVHVDLVGTAGSQYGVDPIIVKPGKIAPKTYATIARKLREALGGDL